MIKYKLNTKLFLLTNINHLDAIIVCIKYVVITQFYMIQDNNQKLNGASTPYIAKQMVLH